MPHNLYNASSMQFCIIRRTVLNKCGDKKKHRAKLARNPKTCFLILWLVMESIHSGHVWVHVQLDGCNLRPCMAALSLIVLKCCNQILLLSEK